jgi:hypothetical protein
MLCARRQGSNTFSSAVDGRYPKTFSRAFVLSHVSPGRDPSHPRRPSRPRAASACVGSESNPDDVPALPGAACSNAATRPSRRRSTPRDRTHSIIISRDTQPGAITSPVFRLILPRAAVRLITRPAPFRFHPGLQSHSRPQQRIDPPRPPSGGERRARCLVPMCQTRSSAVRLAALLCILTWHLARCTWHWSAVHWCQAVALQLRSGRGVRFRPVGLPARPA